MRRMAAYIRAWRIGGDIAAVASAEALPKSGVHHPAAPAPFARVEEYLAWGAGRWPAGAPRVAFAIHAGSLSAMQTRVIDALVAESEARGLVPLVIWFDAADPQALRSLLEPAPSEPAPSEPAPSEPAPSEPASSEPAPSEPAGADVLVNLHHMQNGPARRAEFEALGIPVLQTLGHRDGGPEAWRAAPGGIAAQLVAPFLAVPEGWGMSDPLVIEAVENGEPVPIPEQIDALLGKAAALAALRRTANADKRLALMMWNYPPGEKNLSASNLNVPRSLERLTGALAAAGYDVPPTAEARLIEAGQAMLGGLYRPETLDRLLADGLAEGFPVAHPAPAAGQADAAAPAAARRKTRPRPPRRQDAAGP